MTKQILVVGAVIALIVVMANTPLTDVPQLISFQGKLYDNAGNPLTGQYEVTFRVYDVESGGAHIWSEKINVNCENGLYHVILGQATSINLDFDGQYWLGVQVTGDDELAPRYRLASAPTAFRAQIANSAEQVSWTNVTNIPAGFADGIDDVGGAGGGWVDDGSIVRLETDGDKVGIGTTTPSGKTDVTDGDMNAKLCYYRHTSFPSITHSYSGVKGAYGEDVEGYLGRRYTSLGTAYYGVYGSAKTAGANYGVYGSASGGSANWAGYFSGNVYASGNVGIGTVNPNRELHVNGDINAEGYLRVNDQAAVHATDGNHQIQLGSTNSSRYTTIVSDFGEVIRVAANGRVGIGTTSPSEKLEVSGNLKVTGAYTGNIGPNNGAPFPRPAYDSGWVSMGLDDAKTLTHNIGSNVSNYVVDLQLKDLNDGWGINNTKIGGDERICGGDCCEGYYWRCFYGAYWSHLTTNTIRVHRNPDDLWADQIRVRIWVYN